MEEVPDWALGLQTGVQLILFAPEAEKGGLVVRGGAEY